MIIKTLRITAKLYHLLILLLPQWGLYWESNILDIKATAKLYFFKKNFILSCKITPWVLKMKSISLLECNSSPSLNKLSISGYYCNVVQIKRQVQNTDILISMSYTIRNRIKGAVYYSSIRVLLYNTTLGILLLVLSWDWLHLESICRNCIKCRRSMSNKMKKKIPQNRTEAFIKEVNNFILGLIICALFSSQTCLFQNQ